MALFERSAKSVRLTRAGQAFLIGARAVLERADEAVAQARSMAARGQTELHVGYAPSPTVRIVPAALRTFQERFPQVRVKLHDLSTEEMLGGVREGELQLALLVRPNRGMLRGLHFEELTRDTMCLAAPPAHALARLASVTLAQLAREPLVAFSQQDYPEYHEYLNDLFAALKAKPRITEQLDSSASLIAAVEAGTGVAIVPQSFACFAKPRLKLIPLSPAPEPIVIGAVWSGKRLPPAAEQFLDSAKQAVSNLH